MLVGADGIHSVFATHCISDASGMLRNGIMMWRGTVDWLMFDGGDTMIVSGDMKKSCFIIRSRPVANPGTMLTNWVLCGQLATGISAPPERESWSRRGTMERASPFREELQAARSLCAWQSTEADAGIR